MHHAVGIKRKYFKRNIFMSCIIEYEYEGKGLQRVYENKEWMVGIKNYKPENDIKNIDCLERHNETDELFVLLCGTCILLYALEDITNDSFELKAISMELNKVYNIPKGLWHNTVTQQETKLILIEAAATSQQNSNAIQLSHDQIARAKELISALQKKL